MPGIEENVTQDDCLDAKKIFLEERAGFSEHLAECVTEMKSDGDSVLYLEKMGFLILKVLKSVAEHFLHQLFKNFYLNPSILQIL